MIPLKVNIIINQILIFDSKNYSFAYITSLLKLFIIILFNIFK